MPERDLTRGEEAANVLIVVGERTHAARLRPVLEAEHYRIETVMSLSRPLPHLNARPDIAIIWFPYASPEALPELESIIRSIQSVGHDEILPVLLIVDQDGARWVEPSFRLGITDILMRPIHPLILKQRVRQLLRACRTERMLSQLRRQVAHQERQRMINALDSTLQMFQEGTFFSGVPSRDPEGPCPISIHQNLAFDPEEHCLVLKTGNSTAVKKTKLTAHQTSILSYIICHPYRALGNQEIAREALGYENLDERQARSIIRPHILRLRRKMEDDARQPQILRTVRGSGYIFSPD